MPSNAASTDSSWSARLRSFFVEVNHKEMVHKVDDMLVAWKGREEVLLTNLERTYRPRSISTSPKEASKRVGSTGCARGR